MKALFPIGMIIIIVVTMVILYLKLIPFIIAFGICIVAAFLFNWFVIGRSETAPSADSDFDTKFREDSHE